MARWLLLVFLPLLVHAGGRSSVLDIYNKCEVPAPMEGEETDTPLGAWREPLRNASSCREIGEITICLVEKLISTLEDAYQPHATCPAPRFLTPVELMHRLERFAAPASHLELSFRLMRVARRMSSTTRSQLDILYPRVVHRMAQTIASLSQYFHPYWLGIYRFLVQFLGEVLELPTLEATQHARQCLWHFYLVLEETRPEPLSTSDTAAVASSNETRKDVESRQCRLERVGENDFEEVCEDPASVSVLPCAKGRRVCRFHTLDRYRCYCHIF